MTKHKKINLFYSNFIYLEENIKVLSDENIDLLDPELKNNYKTFCDTIELYGGFACGMGHIHFKQSKTQEEIKEFINNINLRYFKLYYSFRKNSYLLEP